MLSKFGQSTVLKAILQIIPGGYGAALDVFLSDGAALIEKERLHAFLDELGTGSVPVNEDSARKSDYVYAFLRCAQGATSSAKNEKARLFARALRRWYINTESDIDELEDVIHIIDDISYREWQALLLLDSIMGGRPNPSETADFFFRAWPEFVTRAEKELRIPPEEADTYLMQCSRSGLYRAIIGLWADDDTGTKPGTFTPTFYRLKHMLSELAI